MQERIAQAEPNQRRRQADRHRGACIDAKGFNGQEPCQQHRAREENHNG
ncbi:MAG: hypothetical protein R2856_22005 [Caldilineaceae bacterium]